MAFGLFRNTPSFEGGNTNIYNKSNIIENAILTKDFTGALIDGAITNIYDADITSYFKIYDTIASSDTPFLKWDLGDKEKIKSIYAFVELTASNAIFQIQGSNNNTDWTVLASQANAVATTKYNMLASNISHRYIRFIRSSGNQAYSCSIFNMKVVG